MSTEKTLADAQPGGRVRLGDQAERARFEAWVAPRRAIHGFNRCEDMWDAWQAALSAQPSPGGQDARSLLAAEYDAAGSDKRATLIREGRDHAPSTSYALRAIEAALAARQPVGELHLPPDGFYKIVYDDAEVPDESFARTGALDAARRRFEQISARWNAHLFVRFAHNTSDCTVPNATTAQAVGQEPITVEAVATVRRDADGERHIDWLTEGGIADLDAGDVLMVSDRAITDEDGSGEVYAAPTAQQPAQVNLDGLDRALGEAIDQRDRYHEVADDLAGHLARITGADIGEHSSANCPWQNAIEAAGEYKPAQAVDLGRFRKLASWVANCAGHGINDSQRRLGEELLSLIDSQAVGNK